MHTSEHSSVYYHLGVNIDGYFQKLHNITFPSGFSSAVNARDSESLVTVCAPFVNLLLSVVEYPYSKSYP